MKSEADELQSSVGYKNSRRREAEGLGALEGEQDAEEEVDATVAISSIPPDSAKSSNNPRDLYDPVLSSLMEDSEREESENYGKDMGHDDKELAALKRRHASRDHIDDLEDDIHYDRKHDRGVDEGEDPKEEGHCHTETLDSLRENRIKTLSILRSMI